MPQLLQKGIEAFNDSVVITCFVGGVIILVVAVVVRALIPRDVKITEDDEAPGDGDAPLLGDGDPSTTGDGSPSEEGEAPRSAKAMLLRTTEAPRRTKAKPRCTKHATSWAPATPPPP